MVKVRSSQPTSLPSSQSVNVEEQIITTAIVESVKDAAEYVKIFLVN